MKFDEMNVKGIRHCQQGSTIAGIFRGPYGGHTRERAGTERD